MGRSWLVILTRPCIPAVAGGEQEGGKVVGQQRSPNTININTIKLSYTGGLMRTSGGYGVAGDGHGMRCPSRLWGGKGLERDSGQSGRTHKPTCLIHQATTMPIPTVVGQDHQRLVVGGATEVVGGHTKP